jgi:RimJ/RimL family protein N-acetyltransferase
MEFELTHARLRPLRFEDVASLAEHANDAAVARDLPDHFVHPYAKEDAVKFLEHVTVEIGHWLGVAYAGRGITTEAIQIITRWLICEKQLTRVEARLFSRNRACVRVLEKAGYVRETLMRRSAIKAGEILDQELWA